MKKLINDPNQVAEELLEGFLLANKNKVKRVGELTAVARKDAPIEGKVGILIGGGSGHEPVFTEFVGPGMADACANGDVFAAPSPKIILEATKAVDGGKGVLYLYGNYAGDNMNFDIAADLAQKEGIDVETVRVWDDVASAPRERIDERRGIAGDLFIIKIAGAKAARGASLKEVKTTVEKARDNTRSIGVALTSSIIPATGEATFEIGDDEMEVGMGLHGEPGVERTKIKTARETAEMLLEKLINDLPFTRGDIVAVLVNSLGATTRMELLIIYKEVDRILKERGLEIYGVEIGEYCTTLEMAGCSITLLKLDQELKELYNSNANTPGYRFFKNNN